MKTPATGERSLIAILVLFFLSLGLLPAKAMAQNCAAVSQNSLLGPVTGCQVLAYDGVDNGIVTTGGWWTNGLVHIFVFEGDHPEPYGYVTIPVPKTLFPPAADGLMQRPLCQAKLDWTDTDYAGAYDNSGEPPMGFVTDKYDGSRQIWQMSFKWYLSSPPHPHMAFSIILLCPPKVGQGPAPLP